MQMSILTLHFCDAIISLRVMTPSRPVFSKTDF